MVFRAEGGHARPTGEVVRPPGLILFDVNETLSDMSGMAGRFAEVGASSHLATAWFAGLLRDGFALTAAGASASFADIGVGLLQVQLAGLPLHCGLTQAVEHIMGGFDSLDLHPDVASGTAALAGLGLRLVTLSNGSATVAATLFERAGIRDRFELLLSVEDAGVWKPAAGSYRYALDRCHTTDNNTMLVAVHPWDIDGGRRAGLTTAWLNRTGGPYPAHFNRPDIEVTSLNSLADTLSRQQQC